MQEDISENIAWETGNSSLSSPIKVLSLAWNCLASLTWIARHLQVSRLGPHLLHKLMMRLLSA